MNIKTDILESSIPEEFKKDLSSGDVLMHDTLSRCASIEDVNAVIAHPFSKDVSGITIRRYLEVDGTYHMNPEYLLAPFAIYLFCHKDGRKWIVGIKLNSEDS